jgi:S-formylglutathione hydrolase FrmB
MTRITTLLLCFIVCLTATAQVSVEVKLDTNFKGPFTGRLRLYTLNDTTKDFTGEIMERQPAFAIDVKSWGSGESRVFNAQSEPYLIPIDSLRPGHYRLIAVLDTNCSERGNSAAGNLYSSKEGMLFINPEGKGSASIVLNRSFRERPFKETEFVKELRLYSSLLSRFRKDSVYIKAAVILPPTFYLKPEKRYPVVYIIPGWGGTHQHGSLAGNQKTYGIGLGKEKIYVYLNPENQTPWGLHAFVDSRINGPWGAALVNELVPYMRTHYRTSTLAEHTFLTGQSSGGYGVVWLALNYPKCFGGTWATSPDPLDFSSFTGVNLYTDKNYFINSAGEERGIFRVDGVFKNTMRNGFRWERFEGGGQQLSFEAEFGLPEATGRPRPLFDPHTGEIDRQVVDDWRGYDLGLLVKRKGKLIAKELRGKIKVYAGQFDNFLLDQSALAFARKASDLRSHISITIISGADHFSTRSPELTHQIQREIDELIP